MTAVHGKDGRPGNPEVPDSETAPGPREEAELASSETPVGLRRAVPILSSKLSDTGSTLTEHDAGEKEKGPRSLEKTIFGPGDIVAGRYRIVRFLAQGAVGEVYEAKDLELSVRVALKTVRGEIAKERRVIERFRREIQLAHKVTHPNVCRLFDLSYHFQPDARGSSHANQRITFLTMEFLDGETLMARLRRESPMKPAQALPLLEQMAEALEAAHRVGVIHRDFKSSNVMLVEENGRERAVVTDFGLARIESTQDSEGDSITDAGTLIGTPAYMSPEQVEGSRVTPASDIYALGIVMYEMMTGHRPFSKGNALATAVLRLKQPPPAPRLFVPDLDSRWERAILRCLERDPAKRFTSARELVETLQGKKEPGFLFSERSIWRWAAVVLIFLMVVGVGFMAASRWFFPNGSRKLVAVLGFRNLSEDPGAAWISTALTEMLETELVLGEKMRVIPNELIVRMNLELDLKEGQALSTETMARLRNRLGADYFVSGSYLFLDSGKEPSIRFDLRLQDAKTGAMLLSQAKVGPEAEFFDMVSRLGGELRSSLGIGRLSAGEVDIVRATLPRNPAAAKRYSEGLERLRRFDALEARRLLSEAVTLEPDHALAHSALAAAWQKLGFDREARSEARRAFELAGNLSRADNMMVEAQYRETAGQWAKAVEIYQSLWIFYPDQLEYGLLLAAAQIHAGVPRNALHTLAQLRSLPLPESSDPRIDLTEARIAQSLTDTGRQRAAAEKAAAKGEKLGAKILVAEARLLEAAALEARGDLDLSRRKLESARQLFQSAGIRSGVAESLQELAGLLLRQGDHKGAKKTQQEAMEIFRTIGNQSGVAKSLTRLAYFLVEQHGDITEAKNMHYEALEIFRKLGDLENQAVCYRHLAGVTRRLGDMAGSRSLHAEALRIFRKIGNQQGIASSLRSIGWILHLQGNLEEARLKLEAALEIDRKTGNPGNTVISLNALSRVFREQGELARALKITREALKTARRIGDRRSIGYGRYNLGQVYLAMGETKLARDEHEKALNLRLEIGEDRNVAKSQVALATVGLADGSLEGIEKHLSAAITVFRDQSRTDDEAQALAVLSQFLLASGRTDEATSTAGFAQDLMSGSRNQRNQIIVEFAVANCLAAEGLEEEARELLGSLLRDFQHTGYMDLLLEIRWRSGLLELKKDEVRGRELLEKTLTDAATRGFKLLERRIAKRLDLLEQNSSNSDGEA